VIFSIQIHRISCYSLKRLSESLYSDRLLTFSRILRDSISRTFLGNLILVAFFLITTSCQAQNYNELGHFDVHNYSFQEYNRVPQNFTVLQDKRGVLYFGNNSGILEYDGKNWDVILTPKESAVHSLAMDKHGVIYVGGTGEIGYLAPDSIGQMKFRSLLGYLQKKDQDFEEIWTCFVAADGYVYFQTSNQIIRWDGKTMKTFEAKTSFHLMFYLNNTIYVRQSEIGLMCIRDSGLVLLQGGELFAQEKIYFMIPYRRNQILLNTQNQGLFLMKQGTFEQSHRTLNTKEELTTVVPFHTKADEFFTKNWVYSCAKLNKQTISIGTLGSGLTMIDTAGKVVGAINKSTGLEDAFIQNQFLDAQQHLWLATNNGVSKVDINSPITGFDDQNGLEGAVEELTRHEGRLYTVTSAGVYYLEGPAVMGNSAIPNNAHFVKLPGIASECWDLLSFTTAKESKLLVASINGVFQVEKGKSSLLIGKEAAYVLHRSLKDPNRVFVGQGNGICSIYWTEGKWMEEGNLKGISDYITRIDEDDSGDLWLGNNGTGVERIRFKVTNHQFTDLEIMRSSAHLGLPDENVYVKRISGKVCFATPKGLYAYNGERFYPDSSLGSQFSNGHLGIFRISEDNKGKIWMVTLTQKDGQVKMEVGYVERKSGGKTEWINKPFLGISRYITLSLFHDADGVTWLGGRGKEGLLRFDENRVNDYDRDFHSLVRKVILGKDSVIFAGTNFNDSGYVAVEQPDCLKPKLRYSFNSLTFQFSAPNFEDEASTLYSYFLDGFDKQWSGWKNEKKAVYTNLPEGRYFFRVKALNVFGHESSEAVYEFTVLAPWYRTVWAYIGYILFFIGFVWGSIIISTRGLRNIIQERTAEVVKQKEVIELKNKDITDSINYAKRIQEAILPTRENFRSLFPDSFILFKPKDIVSGDFYWLSEKNDRIFIAAADCTGHGVPGAFTSMIGNALLNEIVNDRGVLEPGKILDALREGIIKSLKQSGKEGESKDGMDISLCSINLKNNELEYAGAYNPLFIIRKKELIEVKGDKFPIGISDHRKQFANNNVSLEKGDAIYIFSDGYADQFGGPGGKKYMRKRFKDHLLSIQHLSMEEQRLAINTALVDWQGPSEQVDDILVIGIRI
jgi:serine phosphatase RsbU (regulator of sigma subunit)/ligand-binding sensor domain-containing protein